MGLWLRLRPLRPVLEPERFAALLRALADRRHLGGAMLEVGCFRGATAAEVGRTLRIWRAERPYVCVDTFEGFVPEQFAEDELLGTNPSHRSLFDYNSRRAVERTFRHLGLEIQVLQGDIVTLADELLPPEVAVCLLDVDLAEPTQVGLEKVFPRLVAGGMILVDDCEGESASGWHGARVGYRAFIEERGLRESYDAGLGIIEKPARP
jgi:O-methyltransferase